MELSADIYTVPVDKIVDEVLVVGTWLGGRKIDLDGFVDEVTAIDPTEHQALAQHAATGKCC